MLLKKGLVMGLFVLAGIAAAVPVDVKSREQELPVIVKWQDGHGYQEDGTQIAGGWAYDSINPAGKYVLFGKDGAVVRKSESMEASGIGEDYTGTELVPAVLALRAETFEGFHGTVQVLLEEKSGKQKEVELNDRNFFSLNICVNSGDYTIRTAEAKDSEKPYVTEFSTDTVHLPEKSTRVMKIRVTETKIETAGKPMQEGNAGVAGKEAEPERKPQMESRAGQQEDKEERKEDGLMQDMGAKKVMALFGGIGAACLAGVLLLRRKRKKYN